MSVAIGVIAACIRILDSTIRQCSKQQRPYVISDMQALHMFKLVVVYSALQCRPGP